MSYYFTHESDVVSGFYDSDFHSEIPQGAVLLTDEQYQAAINAQSEGMILNADESGITPTIHQPTNQEQEKSERIWARQELRRTDFIILPDSRYSEADQTAVKAYRALLRNPTRMNSPGFPAQSWRPSFPAGVSNPD